MRIITFFFKLSIPVALLWSFAYIVLLSPSTKEPERVTSVPQKVPQDITESLFFLPEKEQHLMPFLVEGAKRVKRDTECLEVRDGDLRASEYQQPNNPAFLVTCIVSGKPKYANYYFTKEDVEKDRLITLPSPVGKYEAERNCIAALEKETKYPDSIEYEDIRITEAIKANGRRRVTLTFRAKNDFGISVSNTANCLVMQRGQVELSVER